MVYSKRIIKINAEKGNTEMLKKYKKEIILAGALVILSCALFFINRIIFSKPGRQVEISVDGEVVKTLSLDKDDDLVIEGFKGGSNRVLIENGQVRVSEADCPDKVCVKQGFISQNGESIVCLPNRMIARITE